MKYTSRKTVAEEVEFALPAFIKAHDNIWYKIFSETQMVVVKTFSFNTEIKVVDHSQHDPFGLSGWEFTTEEEYLKAENEALQTISQYTNFPETV